MFKAFKVLMSTLLLIFTVFTTVVSADTVKEIINRGEMVVAVQTQGPPFSFINKEGERTGFAIEVVKMMAEDMGVEIVFKDYEWKGLIPALLSKKVDLIAADMTPTPKRALQLNFTDPFFYGEVVAYTKTDNEAKNWEELNKPGVKIGVPQASSHVQYVKDNLPEAEMVELSGGSPAVAQALSVGRVDAGVTARNIANQFTKEFEGIHIVDGVIVSTPLSFPVRPEDTHFLAFINNYFKVRKADNTINNLLDYWVRSDAWEADHK